MADRSCSFSVRTAGGVYDLSRVVNVMALLGLAPSAVEVRCEGAGLRMRLELAADERARSLFVNRLRALPAVIEAHIEPRTSAA